MASSDRQSNGNPRIDRCRAHAREKGILRNTNVRWVHVAKAHVRIWYRAGEEQNCGNARNGGQQSQDGEQETTTAEEQGNPENHEEMVATKIKLVGQVGGLSPHQQHCYGVPCGWGFGGIVKENFGVKYAIPKKCRFKLRGWTTKGAEQIATRNHHRRNAAQQPLCFRWTTWLPLSASLPWLRCLMWPVWCLGAMSSHEPIVEFVLVRLMLCGALQSRVLCIVDCTTTTT